MVDGIFVKLFQTPFPAVIRFAMACLAVLCCCTSQIPLSGTSEQGNAKVIASVYSSKGKAASGAIVRLRRADFLFNPAISEWQSASEYRNVSVGDSGRFCIDSIDIGAYCVEINDGASEATLIKFTISQADQVLRLSDDTLRPYASIRGAVDIKGIAVKRFVQVEGLDRFAAIDSNGAYAFTDLPAGTYTLRFPNADTTINPSVVREISAPAGQTAVIPMRGWAFSKTLRLNTSASGAGISGNIFDFPVMVRLTDSNFVFSQAQARGADIRFTKKNGAPLPYEIELWDAPKRRAILWVKMDTVIGANSSQAITLYWGNANAASRSNPAAVFDTAIGFAGVWHMAESGDTIFDATMNGSGGKNSGSAPAAGVLGNCRSFANGNFIKVPGLFKSPQTVTLSAWVKADTSNPGDVVSIGDAVLIRLDDIKVIGTAGCYHNDAIVADDKYAQVSSGMNLAKTGWHFLTFSVNNQTHVQTLYIDGVAQAQSNDVNPINYAGLGADTYFGVHGNGKTHFNFIGLIDEVRISNCALGPEWIKLCFMNQKERDELVQW